LREQHAWHVTVVHLRDASIACGDKCFTDDEFKRIQRDRNETSNAVFHRSAVWRIRPASVTWASAWCHDTAPETRAA
jgi:hypothetical protein